MGAHRERGVEQQHTLSGPPAEVARRRHRRSCVRTHLPEYVHERRRHRHPVGHRKTHARGLPYVVIRILAENDHFHLVERAGIESREYTRSRRKHLPGCVFRPYEIRKASKTFRLPLRCQCALPRFFYFHIHLANIRKKPYFCRTYPAPIVQWIELRIPVPSIGVRLPMGVLVFKPCKEMHGFFINIISYWTNCYKEGIDRSCEFLFRD